MPAGLRPVGHDRDVGRPDAGGHWPQAAHEQHAAGLDAGDLDVVDAVESDTLRRAAGQDVLPAPVEVGTDRAVTDRISTLSSGGHTGLTNTAVRGCVEVRTR